MARAHRQSEALRPRHHHLLVLIQSPSRKDQYKWMGKDYWIKILTSPFGSFRVFLTMAEAGFFHCPTDQEPDAAMCFMCLKELDGWEPDDDPWQEHKNHSPQCPFLTLKGPIESMTVEEFLNLEATRQKNKLKKLMENKIKEFENIAKDVRKEMEFLAKPK